MHHYFTIPIILFYRINYSKSYNESEINSTMKTILLFSMKLLYRTLCLYVSRNKLFKPNIVMHHSSYDSRKPLSSKNLENSIYNDSLYPLPILCLCFPFSSLSLTIIIFPLFSYFQQSRRIQRHQSLPDIRDNNKQRTRIPR